MASKKIAGIYRITCTVNGKHYIGQSQDIYGRWKQHRSNLRGGRASKLIQADWNMFGPRLFEFVIVEQCTLEIINDRERYWIIYYNAVKTGYNFKILSTYRLSDEEREKRRQNTLTNRRSPGYYHTMLNIYDDELDPYQYRLLGHYKRIANDPASPRYITDNDIAKQCKMSLEQIYKARADLDRLGYITVGTFGVRIHITDLWQDIVNQFGGAS